MCFHDVLCFAIWLEQDFLQQFHNLRLQALRPQLEFSILVQDHLGHFVEAAKQPELDIQEWILDLAKIPHLYLLPLTEPEKGSQIQQNLRGNKCPFQSISPS
jgi:hypothetical protein